MKSQSRHQTPILKGICQIRVKEGERLASEPRPRPQPSAGQSNFSHLGGHVFQSASPSEKKNPEIQVLLNRLLVVRYEGQEEVREKASG